MSDAGQSNDSNTGAVFCKHRFIDSLVENSELYADPSGQAFICFDNLPNSSPIEIRSERFIALIAARIHWESRCSPSKAVFGEIQLIAEGIAHSRPIPPHLLNEIGHEDPLVETILGLVREQKRITGTSQTLLSTLNDQVRGSNQSSAKWPRNASALGRRIRAIQPWLEASGVTVTLTRRSSERRIQIAMKDDSGDTRLAPSVTPEKHSDERVSTPNDAHDANDTEQEGEKKT